MCHHRGVAFVAQIRTCNSRLVGVGAGDVCERERVNEGATVNGDKKTMKEGVSLSERGEKMRKTLWVHE